MQHPPDVLDYKFGGKIKGQRQRTTGIEDKARRI
jgi:hypothetical protein